MRILNAHQNSSFGQTFLISIFVPDLLKTFSLDTAQFGALYAGATLTSAVTLPFFGRLIDRAPLRPFALLVERHPLSDAPPKNAA